MLGRHHLLLSVFTATLLFIPYFQVFTELTLLILIGVAIGSLIPDADSPDAAIFHEKVYIKGNLGKVMNGYLLLFSLFLGIQQNTLYTNQLFLFLVRPS